MNTQPLSKEFVLSFVKKEQVSQDTYTFYFDRTKLGSEFNFLAGQFIKITLPHENPDERGITRNFSITSSPFNGEFLTITTRIIQSSFKKALYNLSEGSEVQFFGPVGKFVLDEQDTQPRTFLAGGIGITPFHSMILYAFEKQLTIPLTLFVSFSTVEEVLFQKELEAIASSNSNIRAIYTVTHPEGSSWTGETGRISKELIQKYFPNYSSSLFYIAGPPVMAQAMEEMVIGMKIPSEQIKKENFVGY